MCCRLQRRGSQSREAHVSTESPFGKDVFTGPFIYPEEAIAFTKELTSDLAAMALSSTLGSLLLFLCLSGICPGTAQETSTDCTDYKLQFERVFTVPGHVAMLNSTLVSPAVFNLTTVPYNITWYNSKTGEEMSNQTGQILVLEETLWFLNVTLDDDGEYMTILRTPSQCYMQSTKLVVDLPVSGECGKPQKASQILTNGVVDLLNCPLGDYIHELESYNIFPTIKWYKGCDLIQNPSDKYVPRDKTKLKIRKVESEDAGLYTCTLTFSLAGITGSVSETIEATVNGQFFLLPQVREPASEIIKAEEGSNFTKRCQVFVPGVGIPFVDVFWMVKGHFILDTSPSERISTSEQRRRMQDAPEGVWFERLLMFSELRNEDFYINYTCRVLSDRGSPEGYFTLLPTWKRNRKNV